MEIFNAKNAPAAIGPYSHAVKTGNLIFLSGQIPLGADGDMVGIGIEAQVEQVFENIKNILEEAGSSLDKVVRIGVFLSDITDFSSFNQVYEDCLGGHKPARSVIEAASLPKGALVEIEAIAEL
ncbi:MAG: Rid family detoxifying hydrolase [SAR324 cluster bacterium]|nr:Rid family detoxifying hydrolase [SAR324 cluster bacterium]